MRNGRIAAFILFSLTLAVFAAADVRGQKKIIETRELYDATASAYKKQNEMSRRIETVTEKFADGGVVTDSLTTILERLLPNKSRYYKREKIGQTVTEHENITIDYMRYTRDNGGAWTKYDMRSGGIGSGSGTGIGSSSACVQMTVETTFFNNLSAKIYEELYISSSPQGLKFKETRYWISDDGLPLKTETSAGMYLPRIESVKTLTTYEYEPKDLKIEAPIK